MIAFEKYLLSVGYEAYNGGGWNGDFKKGYKNISSMVPNGLRNTYFHKDDVKRERGIVIGLHEKDKPITLIYPRPNNGVSTSTKGRIVTGWHTTDDEMNRILQEMSFDKLLSEITN